MVGRGRGVARLRQVLVPPMTVTRSCVGMLTQAKCCRMRHTRLRSRRTQRPSSRSECGTSPPGSSTLSTEVHGQRRSPSTASTYTSVSHARTRTDVRAVLQRAQPWPQRHLPARVSRAGTYDDGLEAAEVRATAARLCADGKTADEVRQAMALPQQPPPKVAIPTAAQRVATRRVVGVKYYKTRGIWAARITVGGESVHLGTRPD